MLYHQCLQRKNEHGGNHTGVSIDNAVTRESGSGSTKHASPSFGNDPPFCLPRPKGKRLSNDLRTQTQSTRALCLRTLLALIHSLPFRLASVEVSEFKHLKLWNTKTF